MTWSDVAVASAFIFGVIIGGIAVIRVTRFVLEHVRQIDHLDNGNSPKEGDDEGAEDPPNRP